MDTNADNSPNSTIVTPGADSSDPDGQRDDADMSTGLTTEEKKVPRKKNPHQWAGFFKNDPFRKEMKDFMSAERAELDAAQK